MTKWSRVTCAVAVATFVCALVVSCANNDPEPISEPVATTAIESSIEPTDAPPTTSTVPASSTWSTVPGDPTGANGSTGWGVDGSGFATVRVRTNDGTSIDTRVFRRSRTEKSGDRIVLNNRDVFVATRVTQTTNGATTATIHVDGFETEGDDPARYPMANFGREGRVSVAVSAKGPEWIASPVAWTVVSRDLLVVLSGRSSTVNKSAGLVEYYDLSTGGLQTALGDAGRTVIPIELGIDDVQDVALRTVDSDGTPRLVVSGLSFDDRGAVDDVVVAGFTPDGRPDPQVGDGGSGRLGLIGSLPDPATHSWWDAHLADPGLGLSTGAVGVLVEAAVVGSDQSVNFTTPTETSVTAFVARQPRGGGEVSLNPANGSFANTIMTGLSFVAVRNVVLDADRSLDAHVSGANAGGFIDPTTGPINRRHTFSSGSATTGVVSKDVSSPFRLSSSRDAKSEERLILDVSSSGKQFAVESFRNSDDGSLATYLCFGDKVCNGNEQPKPRALTGSLSRENGSLFVRALVANTAGVRVLVNETFDDHTTAGHALASFMPDGSPASDPPVFFGGDFGTTEREEMDGRATDRNVRTILEPGVLDSGRLVAVGSTQPDDELNVLHLQASGAAAEDVSLSLPLGVGSYSARRSAFATVGDRSAILHARLWSDAGPEDRLYKVDVENGSVDVAFGSLGYVAVPYIAIDDDGCRWERRIVSGNRVIAVLNVDTDLRTIEDDTRCDDVPGEITWSAFDDAGAPLDGVPATSTANLDGLPFVGITGFAVDAQGSLYVAGFADRFDEANRWTGGDTFVAKFAPSGSADTTFGVDGVVALPGTASPLFSAGSETSIAVDVEGRVYLAASVTDGAGNTDVWLARLTKNGALDVAKDAPPPSTFAPGDVGSMTPLAKSLRLRAAIHRRLLLAVDRVTDERRDATLPPDNGLTVLTTEPILTAVRAVEDRALTVWWSTPLSRSRDYVIATVTPGGRKCASTSGSCVVRGLDPSIAYTVTVLRKGAEADATPPSEVPPTKPVIVLRVGRIAYPTTYVRPASRGAAVWQVDGGCRLNDSNTRLSAPNSPTTCRLSVTTEKFESTPRTTKSVTIVVQK